jgi:SAM-dependent methyltransferase
MKILELGAGARPTKKEGIEIIHLDKVSLPDIEVVMDLNRISPLFSGQKLPFNDNEFDEILAIDVIEHVIDVIPLIEEIYRVLKPGGLVRVRTTNYKFSNAFRDPTHFHSFTLESFDYFDPSSELFSRYGHTSKARFKVLEKKEDGQELVFTLKKI